MAWMNWAASSSWGKTRERTWRVNILSRDCCSRQRQGLHQGESQPSLLAASELHQRHALWPTGTSAKQSRHRQGLHQGALQLSLLAASKLHQRHALWPTGTSAEQGRGHIRECHNPACLLLQSCTRGMHCGQLAPQPNRAAGPWQARHPCWWPTWQRSSQWWSRARTRFIMTPMRSSGPGSNWLPTSGW